MKRPCLILILLVVLAFGLAARVQPSLTRESDASGNVFQVFFGEGRRMFANHFAVKADVYLHSGLYPSIFDQAAQAEEQAKHTNSTEHVDGPGTNHEADAGHDDPASVRQTRLPPAAALATSWPSRRAFRCSPRLP